MHLRHNQAGCLPHERHQRQDYQIPASISSPLGQRLLFQSHKLHTERIVMGGKWTHCAQGEVINSEICGSRLPRERPADFQKAPETRRVLTVRTAMQSSSEDTLTETSPFST